MVCRRVGRRCQLANWEQAPGKGPEDWVACGLNIVASLVSPHRALEQSLGEVSRWLKIKTSSLAKVREDVALPFLILVLLLLVLTARRWLDGLERKAVGSESREGWKLSELGLEKVSLHVGRKYVRRSCWRGWPLDDDRPRPTLGRSRPILCLVRGPNQTDQPHSQQPPPLNRPSIPPSIQPAFYPPPLPSLLCSLPHPEK